MTYEIHKIDNEIDRLPIRLLYVSHSSYDQGWRSIQHSHDFVELFYIVKGEGSFIVNNSEFQVEKNQLVIINSNVSHTEKSSDKNKLDYITLGFDGISFSKKNDIIEESIIFYEDRTKEIYFLIKFLLAELTKDKNQAFLIGHNILEIILIKLNQYKNIETNESTNIKTNSVIHEIKKYIDLNYSNPISLDDLSTISHLNKYYLSHAFKSQTGLSPIEYLNNTRIKNAKILLESTSYSISEIGRFTGFSSQSFFSQRFKKITSFSPKKYRESKQME